MMGNRANRDKMACFGIGSGEIKGVGRVRVLKRLKMANRRLKIELGFDMVGIELDKNYYDAACKRLKDHQKNLSS